MSDEQQVIYLDPDDDLNEITERLASTREQRVAIVVSQQGEMRSNVSWRLLNRRARDMGKDVTVISADRQVRSNAKVAGFRVFDALDATSSGGSRPTSRFPRSRSEGRPSRQTRSPFERRSGGSRGSRELPSSRLDAAQPGEASGERSRDEDVPTVLQTREPAGEQRPVSDIPPSSLEEDHFDQPHEFPAGASYAAPLQPSPRSEKSSNQQEPDPYQADYETARRLRESWESGRAEQAARASQPSQVDRSEKSDMAREFSLPPAGNDLLPTGNEPGSSFAPPVGEVDFEPASSASGYRSTFPERDPFGAMEDTSSVTLPEQRGSAYVEDMEDGVPDIAEKVADIKSEHQIEDLGDIEGPGVPQDKTKRQLLDALADEEPEDYQPRRVFGSQPRGSRSGGLLSRQANHFSDPDQLPPVEDRPTVTPILPVQPSVPGALPAGRQTGGLGTRTNLGAASAPQKAQRNVTLPPSGAQPGLANRSGAPSRPLSPAAPATQAIPRRGPQASSSQRAGRVAITILIILVLLFLGGVGLVYFGTSATVTLTVPAKTVSLKGITLVASTTPQHTGQNAVASQVLSFPASASVSGTATGRTPQGNSRASGTATFTNHGAQQVDIPSNTSISTPAGVGTAGVVFVTTADAVVPANSSVPIPIQAQNSGSSGNVGSGKITVIPADSLTAIAKFNNVPTSSLNLSVTNPADLMGGGAANVPTATKNDIAALKLKLHQGIKDYINNYLKPYLQNGGQRGKVIPDVLDSSNPLPEEVLTQAPAPGQPLTSTTITGTMTVQVKVLVVRAAQIQATAQQQLDNSARKESPSYTITTAEAPVNISNPSVKRSQDGTTLTITLNAKGQAVLFINTKDLSSYLVGKQKSQAIAGISDGDAGIRGVQHVDITLTPSFLNSFLNLLPFRPENIHIIVQPGQGPTQKGTPNG